MEGIDEVIAWLDEYTGLLDSARTATQIQQAADELIAATNATATETLQSLRDSIDVADSELSTLESTLSDASETLSEALSKIDTADIALGESVELNFSAAQTAADEFDAALQAYNSKLTSIADSVDTYNASSSFPTKDWTSSR